MVYAPGLPVCRLSENRDTVAGKVSVVHGLLVFDKYNNSMTDIFPMRLEDQETTKNEIMEKQ